MLPGLHDERPIFQQIAEFLEGAIFSGAYPEETQVPSITELSVNYKINPATALKGVNLLVDQGILYKKRGVGMFVSAGAKARIEAARRQEFYGAYIAPLLEEAARLGINRQELAQMIARGGNEG